MDDRLQSESVLHHLFLGINAHITVDKVFGSADEWVISRLIEHWLDDVWQKAIHFIETGNTDEQALQLQEIENKTIRLANAIMGRKSILFLGDLF